MMLTCIGADSQDPSGQVRLTIKAPQQVGALATPLSLSLYVSVSVCVSVYLSVCLPVCLSVCLSVSLYV